MDGMDKRNNVRVPLQVVIDAVESADNEWNQFLDIMTMEAVSVPESLFIDNFGDEYQKLSDMTPVSKFSGKASNEKFKDLAICT